MHIKIAKLIITLLICFKLPISAHEYIPSTYKKVIVFDFGGVVGHFDRTIIYSSISHTFDIPTNDIKAILTELKTHLFLGGDEKLFWEEIAKSQGRELPQTWLTDFREILASSIREIPGTLPLIKELKKQGYQVALLSNVRRDKAEVYRNLGYYSHFDPILLSCDLGLAKPDPNIFLTLLEKLKVSKTQCLFIDDRIENVKAAHTLGIDSIQFFDSHQLERALAERGIHVQVNYTCPSTY